MSTLASIQAWVVSQLAADPWLIERNITALDENKGDLTNAIAIQMQKLGICALVIAPSWQATSTASCAAYGTAEVAIQIFETVLTNRRKANHATALDTAEHIAASLNMRPISCQGTSVSPAGTLVLHSIQTATITDTIICWTVLFNVSTVLYKKVTTPCQP